MGTVAQRAEVKPGAGWQRFRAWFGQRARVFLPVIYAWDESQTLRNVETVRNVGADGVFLINHGMGYQGLLRITAAAISKHGPRFVGVNCLDLRTHELIRRLPDGVAGVWSNDVPALGAEPETVDALDHARRMRHWDGLLLAPLITGEAAAASGAAETRLSVDVPTIVGRGIGSSEEVDVVRSVSESIGEAPLAIAAGVDSDYVDQVLPFVNCVMTAARGNEKLEEVDQDEARRLSDKVHTS